MPGLWILGISHIEGDVQPTGQSESACQPNGGLVKWELRWESNLTSGLFTLGRIIPHPSVIHRRQPQWIDEVDGIAVHIGVEVDAARGPDGIGLDKTPQHRVVVAQAVVVETRGGVVGPARVAKRVAELGRSIFQRVVSSPSMRPHRRQFGRKNHGSVIVV